MLMVCSGMMLVSGFDGGGWSVGLFLDVVYAWQGSIGKLLVPVARAMKQSRVV